MVLFLALPSSIGSLSLSASNFVTLHPELISELAGHALVHDLYSHIHSNRKTGLSRRLRRKNANIRRRWFVDNIILHHKRLHDKNRELAIVKAREQAVARRDALKKKQELALEKARNPQKEQERKWRELVELKERSNSVRGRIDSRRMRARSRWLSVSEGNPTS